MSNAADLTQLPPQLPCRADASFVQQAGQALSRLDAALAALGGSLADLLEVRVYVTEMEDWAAFDLLYRSWIGSHTPRRSIVRTGTLLHGFALEVEAVAALVGQDRARATIAAAASAAG